MLRKEQNKEYYRKSKAWAEANGYDFKDMILSVLKLKENSISDYKYGRRINPAFKLMAYFHDNNVKLKK